MILTLSESTKIYNFDNFCFTIDFFPERVSMVLFDAASVQPRRGRRSILHLAAVHVRVEPLEPRHLVAADVAGWRVVGVRLRQHDGRQGQDHFSRTPVSHPEDRRFRQLPDVGDGRKRHQG